MQTPSRLSGYLRPARTSPAQFDDTAGAEIFEAVSEYCVHTRACLDLERLEGDENCEGRRCVWRLSF